MAWCATCGGHRVIWIEGTRRASPGEDGAFPETCPSCKGTGTPAVAPTGGCISEFIGWVLGWVLLAFLTLAALTALVFVLRSFGDDDGGAGVLVAAASGVAHPAAPQVGSCYPADSTWLAVPCDGPHASEL